MNSISGIKKLFIKIAGYDLETAKSCTSSEINKMAKHGTLVLIPAIVGMFSMFYAIYLISNNRFIALVGALAWSIIIFFIDRSIVSSKNFGFNLDLVFRFFLAIVIGFVVAEPVVLLAFKGSIKESIHNIYLKEKNDIEKKYESNLKELDNMLVNPKIKLDRLQIAYTEEMDGTGGSGKPNKGPIFKQKYADYQNQLEFYNNLKKEVDATRRQILIKKENEINDIKKNQSNGLLGQFRALNAINDKSVTYATWALRLLFFFIEIIPFMIKLSPGNKPDLYWNIAENTDNIQLEIIKSANTLKKELMESEERALNMEKMLKLNEVNIQKIATYNEKATFYLMNELKNATDKKLKLELKIHKIIKYPKLKEKLLTEINKTFSNYFHNMEELIEKNNNFFMNFKTNLS